MKSDFSEKTLEHFLKNFDNEKKFEYHISLKLMKNTLSFFCASEFPLKGNNYSQESFYPS